VLALAAVIPTVGVAAASGAALPQLTQSASSTTIPLAYDRADVTRYNVRLAEQKRAVITSWYRVVLARQGQERLAERQRASRGEPRRALTAPLTPGQYWRPTAGTLTQPFHPGHDGIDIGVPVGTPVVAAADGIVTFVGVQSGYGNHVEVRHPDGVVTTYSHLSGFSVAVGQPVRAGQQIAFSGNTGHSTGPHLHFEVHPPGAPVVDPIAWLAAHGAW
jgi:murein DD-endopeptidase MepM/ murein hydrolase activator NlpD